MKKIILFFFVVFYSVNTSMSYAQNNIVSIMDRFVMNTKGSPTDKNDYHLGNIYLTIKNLQTGVTYKANAYNYSILDGYSGYQYIFKTNQTFNNIKESDLFEITVAFNRIKYPIKSCSPYAGVNEPRLIDNGTKFICTVTGHALAGIARSPIPFVFLYF